MNWKSIFLVFLLATAVTLFAAFRVVKHSSKPSDFISGHNSEHSADAPTEIFQDYAGNKKETSLTRATVGDAENLAEAETKAFRFAQKLETHGEAKKLFADIVKQNPKNTLAAQMLTELSKTTLEKEQTADFLHSSYAKCAPCSDLGLITTDLLLNLDRRGEAILLIQKLKMVVTTESERRHLASLLLEVGDFEGARAILENVYASRKRLKTRRGVTSAAELTWEKIDSTKLSSLTAPKG